MAEYRLSNNARIRTEVGAERAQPYNGFATEISTANVSLARTHALLSYEQSGLLVRGWWNGLFTETDHHILPPLSPILGLTDRFGRMGVSSSSNTYDFETRYRFTPLEALKVNIGVNYRRIIHSANNFSGRTTEDRFGLYAQGDWQVLPYLELSAGLRYDLDTFITPTLSPRGALVYHLNPNHALRLSGSAAYRPPTTTEVGLSILNPVTLPGFPPQVSIVTGSTNVKPEHISSYEIGYQGWWWEHRLRTRVTGFLTIFPISSLFVTQPATL